MNRSHGAGTWMGAAFCAALILAAITLATKGVGEKGTIAALRVTARFSLLLFWPAYAGGPLAKMFGPAFAILARHGRDFGLSFAAAHLVHIGLIIWFYRVAARPPPLTDGFILFECVGLVWIYVLAAFSIKRLGAMVSPPLRRAVFAIGLEYIALVFFANFVVIPIERVALYKIPVLLGYLPFSILIVAGQILRWTAMARSADREKNDRRSSLP